MSVKVIKEYEYHAPSTLDEVKQLLTEYKADAKILAGGTDLVPQMKAQVRTPAHVISLKNVEELTTYEYDKDSGLKLKANVKLHDMQLMSFMLSDYTSLHQGISSMSSTQIRNLGTLAGNICNAVPSADGAPPLIALGAEVKLESSRGTRTMLVEDFMTGVLKTAIEADEILTEIYIPALPAHSGSSYRKFSQRRALDLAMVGVATWIKLDGNIVADAKIALGAVAIKPKRAENAEKALIGKNLTEEIITEVAEIAGELDCSPITDMRATAEYRREMVKAMTRETIREAASYCEGR